VKIAITPTCWMALIQVVRRRGPDRKLRDETSPKRRDVGQPERTHGCRRRFLRIQRKPIGTKHDEFHSRLWELLRQVANPNVHGLDKELTFRVKECDTTDVSFPEELRCISLNGNVEVARGAFNAAVRCYPTRRWMLLWGSYIVERYYPPPPEKRNAE
jgi:hypothetical protein